jgi:hypothetical protein
MAATLLALQLVISEDAGASLDLEIGYPDRLSPSATCPDGCSVHATKAYRGWEMQHPSIQGEGVHGQLTSRLGHLYRRSGRHGEDTSVTPASIHSTIHRMSVS